MDYHGLMDGMEHPNRTAALPAGVVLAALAVLASGCGRGAAPASSADPAGAGTAPPDPAEIVLRVGESAYSNADVLAALQPLDREEALGLSPEVLSRLFDDFVDEKLLLEAARTAGIALTEEEKRSAPADPDTEPATAAEPVQPSRTLLDRMIIEKYAFQALGGLDVTPEETAAYYEANKKEFLQPERLKVSQVLLPTEQRAVEVLRGLEGVGQDGFRAAAREASIGPEATRGGEIGVFKAGDLPADLEKTVFALDEGRISSVFESAYGFHIFRLDKRYPPELLPEAEAAPAIRARLLERKRQAALAAHLAELKTVLVWSVVPEHLFFPYHRNAS